MAWGGHWEKYGQAWTENINNFNTVPDEIIIVSDKEVDTSFIKITNNVKNIVGIAAAGQNNVSYYRNLAIENSTSEWIVASDLDDTPLPNYIDNLDDSSDIHGFSFLDGTFGQEYYPDQNSLFDRVNCTPNKNNLIPGTSATKAEVFKKIKYENNVYEDHVLYSAAHSLNLKVATDSNIRFVYSGWHTQNEDLTNTTKIYRDMFLGERNLFVCWFSGEMSDKRKTAFETLSESCNVNLTLITKDKLYELQNPELPVHKGFEFLTDTHKSDYARAYLMYFYGGGYSDIKTNSFDWSPYFDQLLISRYDAIGYSERSPHDVANFWQDNNKIQNIVLNRYADFAGNGHFIFKPRTKFAYDWITEIHKLMDENYDQLKNNPGVHPYMVRGGFHSGWDGDVPAELIGHGYPFNWTDIGGTTRHRLEYEHGLNIFKKGMPFPNINNYR